MSDALKRLEEKVTKTFESLEKTKEELRILEKAKSDLETKLSEKERELAGLKSASRRFEEEKAHILKQSKDKTEKFKHRLEGVLTKLNRLETELSA